MFTVYNLNHVLVRRFHVEVDAWNYIARNVGYYYYFI